MRMHLMKKNIDNTDCNNKHVNIKEVAMKLM